MLEFEEILRKYGLCSEHDIKVAEALDIEECRKLLDEKIKNNHNTINDVLNIRKKAEEKQLLLLKEIILDNASKRIYKRSREDIEDILRDLKTNELIIGESINKIKNIFNRLEKIREYHIKEENNIENELKKQYKKISSESFEIEVIDTYINSDEFRTILEI